MHHVGEVEDPLGGFVGDQVVGSGVVAGAAAPAAPVSGDYLSNGTVVKTLIQYFASEFLF